MKHVILSICILAGATSVFGQDETALPEKSERRNTIKIDLTSRWLYSNAISVSYEHLTKHNQSYGITVGYQEFPRSSRLGDSISVRDDKSRMGYKIGGEYRFYLMKENKFAPPRGIYIGPYFTFHNFKNERIIEVAHNGNPETVSLDSRLTILNVGFQLGYQFLFKDRWVIDLVLIGPAMANYRCTLDLGGSYTFDKEDIENEIILDLIDQFPLLEEAIDEEKAVSNGKLDVWTYGYRYQLQIGYHFGRKKQ